MNRRYCLKPAISEENRREDNNFFHILCSSVNMWIAAELFSLETMVLKKYIKKIGPKEEKSFHVIELE